MTIITDKKLFYKVMDTQSVYIARNITTKDTSCTVIHIIDQKIYKRKRKFY